MTNLNEDSTDFSLFQTLLQDEEPANYYMPNPLLNMNNIYRDSSSEMLSPSLTPP